MANLTPTQERVLATLLKFVDFKTGETFVGARKIADKADLALSTVQSCLKDFEQAGIISKVGTRPGTHGIAIVWRVSATYRQGTGNVPTQGTEDRFVPNPGTSPVRTERTENQVLSDQYLSYLIERTDQLINLSGLIKLIDQRLERIEKHLNLSDPSDPNHSKSSAPAAPEPELTFPEDGERCTCADSKPHINGNDAELYGISCSACGKIITPAWADGVRYLDPLEDDGNANAITSSKAFAVEEDLEV
jgi:hypothetical protein